MGCNTSQELKTKEAAAQAADEGGAAVDAGSNAEEGATKAINGENGGEKALANATGPLAIREGTTRREEKPLGEGTREGATYFGKAEAAARERQNHHHQSDQRDATAFDDRSHDLSHSEHDHHHNPHHHHGDHHHGDHHYGDHDAGDEEDEAEFHIPYHHHHHGSQKIRRNPLKNLDLDFKFDVNSF